MASPAAWDWYTPAQLASAALSNGTLAASSESMGVPFNARFLDGQMVTIRVSHSRISFPHRVPSIGFQAALVPLRSTACLIRLAGFPGSIF